MNSRYSLALTMVLALQVAEAVAADWPNYRGPNYDGISAETDWDPQALNAVKIAWQAEVGFGCSSLSVAGGKAYTMGNINKNTDVIYCFDAAGGKERWRHEYPEPLNPINYEGGTSATPTVHEGKVYTLSKSGKVFCVDAETGAVVWNRNLPHKDPGWGFSSSGLIVGDAIIFNLGPAGVALNKNSGQVVWDSGDSECGYATPAPCETADGKTLIVLFGKDTLMAVDPADGKRLWSFPWKTEHDINAANPVIHGDEFLITSGYNRGAALVKVAGQPTAVWENKAMRCQMSGPVRIGAYIYGINQNELACLEWNTGNTAWTERTVGNGALSAAGDKLIVVSQRGRLMIVAATPEGFNELAGADILSGRCWTPPTLSNGFIYARNSQGKLVCVDVRVQ